MLSVETEAKLAQIFLTLAEGEKIIDINRQILIELEDFDPSLIFTYLDSGQKNYLNSADIINYLNENQIQCSDLEINLIIMFYDKDYNCILSYPEFCNLIQSDYVKRSLIKKNSDLNINSNLILPPDIIQALNQLFNNEINLSQKIIFLINDLKGRYDFNIHNLFHAVKYWKFIEENSLRNFFEKNKIDFLESDIRKIMKRLDFNKDGKIDFCEFHSFLGYPDCKYCCPIEECKFCGVKCCNLCICDVPCFLHNCVHEAFNDENNNDNENDNKKENDINYENEESLDEKNNIMENNNENLDNKNNNFKYIKNDEENKNQNNVSNEQLNPINERNSYKNKISHNLELQLPSQNTHYQKTFSYNTENNLKDKYFQRTYNSNFYHPIPCEKCINNHINFKKGLNMIIHNKNNEIKPYQICQNNHYNYCKICNLYPCQCCSKCKFYPCKCCSICLQKPNISCKIHYQNQCSCGEFKHFENTNHSCKYCSYSEINKCQICNNLYKSMNNYCQICGNIFHSEYDNNQCKLCLMENNDNNKYEKKSCIYGNKCIFHNAKYWKHNPGCPLEKNFSQSQEYFHINNDLSTYNSLKRKFKIIEHNSINKKDENNNIPENNIRKMNFNNDYNNKYNYHYNSNISNEGKNEEINFYSNNENIISNRNITKSSNLQNNITTPNFSINKKNIIFRKNIHMKNPEINQIINNTYKTQPIISSFPYKQELYQFIDLLGLLMEAETKKEDIKIEICNRADFNFEDIFFIFSNGKKNYIETQDLKQGLKLLGLNISAFDIKLLLKRYDLNYKNFLSCNDFFDLIIPFENSVRNEIQSRGSNKCCICNTPETFECDTLISIKKFFEYIIESEKDINQRKIGLDSLREKFFDVIQVLDVNKKGVIYRNDLKFFLNRFNIFTNSRECDLLFIRLDRNRNAEVKIDDIKNELMVLN